MVGQAELDCVEVASGDQFAKVEVGFAVGVSVSFIAKSLCLVAMTFIDVADGYHLDFIFAEEASHIAGALRAYSDSAHYDAVARGCGSEYR